jgi:hypothetical protein
MNKDNLVHEIGMMLMSDPDISSSVWRHLVMVAQVMQTSTKVNGFTYDETGEATPASPDNFAVFDKFKDLREAMREPGRDPWKAALVRIDRASLKISIDFEYDRPEKWLISPATVKKMAEVLRPAEE